MIKNYTQITPHYLNYKRLLKSYILILFDTKMFLKE